MTYFVRLAAIVIGVFALLHIGTIFEWLFAFLMVGLIPGTSLSVPPSFMLLGFLLLFAFTLRWVIGKQLYFWSPAVRAAHKRANIEARQAMRKKTIKKTAPKRSLPTRRYAKARG